MLSLGGTETSLKFRRGILYNSLLPSSPIKKGEGETNTKKTATTRRAIALAEHWAHLSVETRRRQTQTETGWMVWVGGWMDGWCGWMVWMAERPRYQKSSKSIRKKKFRET